jgi:hypothetical protein
MVGVLEMTESEQNEILDDLLQSWHRWAQGEQHADGFASTSAGLSDWRASRQWDDQNGALDGELDKSTMKTVDFQVGQMADPYRAAIHMNAKNLAAGRNVFQSPRVPTGIEGANILKTARASLVLRLVAAGVI